MSSLLLFEFYTERFKIKKINFIWILIATLQIGIYFFSKNNTEFITATGGSYLGSLFYLPFLLIIFHLLNYIYKWIYGIDAIIMNTKINKIGDKVGERKITAIDAIFYFLGLILIILSTFIIKF